MAFDFSAANSREEESGVASQHLTFHERLTLFRPGSRTAGRDGRGLSLVADTNPSGAPLFRKENRKDLQTARPKCARATEQVKSPHSQETFAVAIGKAGPGAAEVFLPGEECRVVVRTDVLDLFNDENTFRCAGQTSEGRKHGIWENVALDPGIGIDARSVPANSLAKKQAILA